MTAGDGSAPHYTKLHSQHIREGPGRAAVHVALKHKVWLNDVEGVQRKAYKNI